MRSLHTEELKKAIKEADLVYVLVRVSSEEEVYVQVTKSKAAHLATQVQRAQTMHAYNCLYIGYSDKVVPEPPKPIGV